MIPVFADTYYYAALLNPADAGHARALAFARTCVRPVVTTAWILTELGDGLCNSANRHVFAKLLSMMRSDPTTMIVPAEQELMDRGVGLYLARPDKEWSLTDCISFVVMQDRNLSEALTGDHHFEQAGFLAILKD